MEFDARAFETAGGHVYIALVAGSVAGGDRVLARVHSECLTGDAFGSLRCDCGIQLRTAMKRIAAEGNGVVVYATGHEGRGIGIVNKLKAYVQQDQGSDTIDANLHLGLPVDSRRYDDAAAVLKVLQVRSIRLMTNNPLKVDALKDHGIDVAAGNRGTERQPDQDDDQQRLARSHQSHLVPRGSVEHSSYSSRSTRFGSSRAARQAGRTLARSMALASGPMLNESVSRAGQ